MSTFAWMAWTPATAIFFVVIFSLLAMMTILALRYPERPRAGILGLRTTRGDRLFITLLGSAFIHLAWLGLSDADAIGASVVSLVYAAAVFRWV